MKTDMRIFCANTAAHYDMPMGTTLKELSDDVCRETAAGLPVLAALVDNQL